MDTEPRLAVLEQIAKDTVAALQDLRTEMHRSLDQLERHMEALEKRQHTDFLWLVSLQIAGFAALLGVMAHGFHWI